MCSILAKYIGIVLIKFPAEETEVEKLTYDIFKRFGFTEVIGRVNRNHITIKLPSENAQGYFCYQI